MGLLLVNFKQNSSRAMNEHSLFSLFVSGKPVKSTLEAYYLNGPSSMPREDVAKFMIDCLTKEEFYRKAVAIGI